MSGEPRASNRVLVAGFILSTIFTTGLTLGGGYFFQSAAAQHSDRKSEADQYQGIADAMDPLVRAFMSNYLAGRQTEKERLRLQDNIQRQYVALEHAERILPPEDAARSRAYRDQIVAVSGMLDHLPAPAAAQALVQAIATARDNRIDVANSLRSAGDRWLLWPT